MLAKVSNIRYNYKSDKPKKKIKGYYKNKHNEINIWPNTYPVSEPIQINFCYMENHKVKKDTKNFLVTEMRVTNEYHNGTTINLELVEN